MTQWKKVLKSLGFSESESEIYLTSLAMGPASVQDIAKKANVSRVTTYAVIETLTDRGLMSSVEKGKKHLFAAESPERLVSFVHAQVKEMEGTLKEVEGSLNELKLMQQGEKPVVKMFEGHEALRAIQDDIIASQPKQIDEFGNIDEIFRIYSHEELAGFFKELDRFKAHTRGYYLGYEREVKPGRTHTNITALPKDKFQFNGDIIVYGNKVALSTFRGKQISILIESEELAKTVRAMFNLYPR